MSTVRTIALLDARRLGVDTLRMVEPLEPSTSATLAAVRLDHGCFGCGDANPIGLHLRFTATDTSVSAPFVPEHVHQGFDAIVHGGIISTVLDEAMAWAATTAGAWTVTAEMNVRFRSPLAVGHATTVTGRVTANRGRVIATAADLVLDTDGTVIASATARFVRVSDAQAEEWERRYVDSPQLLVASEPHEPPSVDQEMEVHR